MPFAKRTVLVPALFLAVSVIIVCGSALDLEHAPRETR